MESHRLPEPIRIDSYSWQDTDSQDAAAGRRLVLLTVVGLGCSGQGRLHVWNDKSVRVGRPATVGSFKRVKVTLLLLEV